MCILETDKSWKILEARKNSWELQASRSASYLIDFNALTARCNTSHSKSNVAFSSFSVLHYQYNFSANKLTFNKKKIIKIKSIYDNKNMRDGKEKKVKSKSKIKNKM